MHRLPEHLQQIFMVMLCVQIIQHIPVETLSSPSSVASKMRWSDQFKQGYPPRYPWIPRCPRAQILASVLYAFRFEVLILP